jgi:GDP-L-fucose synthase
MDKTSRIYVAGHKGLVGSSIIRCLKQRGYKAVITRTHEESDLLNQQNVYDFFKKEKPEYVFLAAAKVGGILANNRYRADFIYENLQIQNNIIHQSYLHNVKKLLFLGSSCIYPKACPQPIKEEYLLTGELEYTNEPYAIAKIAGIKMCESYNIQYGTNFICAMPTNLYGPNDNFDPEKSHAFPALIKKFYEARINNKKEVVIFGTGEPKREFLFVDDLADALLFLMHNYEEKYINIGTGKDISIRELANLIKKIVGFSGNLIFDHSKPDGAPRKLLDVTKLSRLGWNAQTRLKDGIEKTLAWYMKHKK